MVMYGRPEERMAIGEERLPAVIGEALAVEQSHHGTMQGLAAAE
jgi:hypothetical protein